MTFKEQPSGQPVLRIVKQDISPRTTSQYCSLASSIQSYASSKREAQHSHYGVLTTSCSSGQLRPTCSRWILGYQSNFDLCNLLVFFPAFWGWNPISAVSLNHTPPGTSKLEVKKASLPSPLEAFLSPEEATTFHLWLLWSSH